MSAKPFRELRDVPVSRGDGEDCLLGVIDARRRLPAPTVDLDEDPERDPGGTLVAVRKWVVLRESDR
jgi:hypothetical protein